jgi:O-antigen ligase
VKSPSALIAAWAAAIAGLFMALPWLNPFAGGPSPAVGPWLTSLVCATLAMCALTWHGFSQLSNAPPGAHTNSGAQNALAAPTLNLAKITAAAWLTAALLSATIGLLQYFGLSGAFDPWVNGTQAGEAFGNLRQRNQFASLMNIGLLALIWLVAQGAARDSQNQHETQKTIAISIALTIAAALLSAANAASSSRTGLLQLGLVVALVWWWGGFKTPKTRQVLATAVLAYMAASALLPLLAGLEWGSSGILGRAREVAAPCNSRLTLWGNVLHLISLKPGLGWGWGELDFAHFITLYPAAPTFVGQPAARFCDILDNAHNLPLHLAVELGIPLAVLICGTGLWLVLRAKPWRETCATRQMAWGVLAVIVLHSLLEYPLWYGPFQMAFALCVWLLLANAVLPPVLEQIIATTRYWQAQTAIFFVAFILFLAALAAWDYHRISQIYLPPEQRSAAYQTNTLQKIKGTWLFQDQVLFAELTTTAVTLQNAAQMNSMAHGLLHFSPEARVAEKLIESATLLGKTDEAAFFEARLQAAFPGHQVRSP